MRVEYPATLFSAVLAVLACTGGGAGDVLSDDLKKDLALSAAQIELASNREVQPMRFVSEIEQVQAAEPIQRTRSPRRVATQTAGTEEQESEVVAPESKKEVQVAEVPAPAPQAPAPSPEVSSVPTVAPRPVALPVDLPADGGRGYGGYGTGRGAEGIGTGGAIGIGDIIGVVIRGGAVGPDHCPPRRRPRTRGIDH
jgi:hypothetical protein